MPETGVMFIPCEYKGFGSTREEQGRWWSGHILAFLDKHIVVMQADPRIIIRVEYWNVKVSDSVVFEETPVSSGRGFEV